MGWPGVAAIATRRHGATRRLFDRQACDGADRAASGLGLVVGCSGSSSRCRYRLRFRTCRGSHRWRGCPRRIPTSSVSHRSVGVVDESLRTALLASAGEIEDLRYEVCRLTTRPVDRSDVGAHPDVGTVRSPTRMLHSKALRSPSQSCSITCRRAGTSDGSMNSSNRRPTRSSGPRRRSEDRIGVEQLAVDGPHGDRDGAASKTAATGRHSAPDQGRRQRPLEATPRSGGSSVIPGLWLRSFQTRAGENSCVAAGAPSPRHAGHLAS